MAHNTHQQPVTISHSSVHHHHQLGNACGDTHTTPSLDTHPAVYYSQFAQHRPLLRHAVRAPKKVVRRLLPSQTRVVTKVEVLQDVRHRHRRRNIGRKRRRACAVEAHIAKLGVVSGVREALVSAEGV